MKTCWPDGDLRAYLDGEMPPGPRERIGEHLERCGACEARCRELSERAARVSGLLAALSEDRYVTASPALPAPVTHRRQWAVAALSLAAALAIAFVLPLKHRSAEALPAVKPAVATVPAAPVRAAVERPRVVPHAAARPSAIRENFLRLDDETIETGTVVRVSTENGDVQAELLLGPDGRAHAIRMIGNQ